MMPDYTVYGWVNVRVRTTVTAADPEAAKRKAKGSGNRDNWWIDDSVPSKPRTPSTVYAEVVK